MTVTNLFVVTGGPGAGKTTLLNAMKKRNYQIVPEEARKIIQEQVKTGGKGLPWEDKSYYAELMLEASLQTFLRISKQLPPCLTFFDRGILDTICYMKMENILVSDELDYLVREYSYNHKVFILPPWQKIYHKDNERKQTWKEAVLTFEKMRQTYLHYGYEVIEVPRKSVEERCEFITEHLT